MKRNLKRILFAAGFLICGFIFGACGTSVEAKQDKPLKIWLRIRMERWKLISL